MWAMIVKEFRQLRRDRRTLAMMIVMPVLLLTVFGYAASFDVTSIPVDVYGPTAEQVAPKLPPMFDVQQSDPDAGIEQAEIALRDGEVPVVFVTEQGSLAVYIDGSQIFIATATKAALAAIQLQGGPTVQTQILFNPTLDTSAVMVPGLAGMILLFMGTILTSLGVVRERQAGTLEQLAVMPLRPRDVFLGKIAPYFVVSSIDLAIVVATGVVIFDVPFNGSLWVLLLGALLFMFVALGIGVLISSVSQNQGQAIQLALMTLLPQILLSGLIFPLYSMPVGVRWISYLLPLTYFTEIARGVMLRGAPFSALLPQFVMLSVLGLVVMTAATLRFRSLLSPSGRG
jgi:ABC-2 type transport system permease protein